MIRNDSRVIPGRIRGTKAGSGGRFEILLCTENAVNDWWVLLRPGKRVHPGTRLLLNDRSSTPCGIEALVQEKNAEGHVRLQFVGCNNLLEHLQEIGELPLPPYIRRDSTGPRPEDESRYQTVYAGRPGSLAAPTAGLHYTPELLEAIRNRGVEIHNITLHIGLGTFAPVKTDEVEDHIMHSERFEIPEPTACAVREAMTSGRRVVAVGTTATRALESAAAARQGRVEAMSASTSIFIRPPTDFRVIGALQTNFHLPQSTLLMLVAAFASPGRTDGRDWILSVYHQAIERDYRFFSYGDSMFIS